MSGFYTISWCVWTIWAVATVAGCPFTANNFRRAEEPRERRASSQGLIILLAVLSMVIVAALVPLPPDPVQLWRVFAGRGAALLIVVVVVLNALTYDREIREHEAHRRQKEWRKEAGL